MRRFTKKQIRKGGAAIKERKIRIPVETEVYNLVKRVRRISAVRALLLIQEINCEEAVDEQKKLMTVRFFSRLLFYKLRGRGYNTMVLQQRLGSLERARQARKLFKAIAGPAILNAAQKKQWPTDAA